MELKNLSIHKNIDISVPWQQLPTKPVMPGRQTSPKRRQFLLPSPSASSSSPPPHLSSSSPTIHLPPSPPLTNSSSPSPRNSRYMKSSSPQLVNTINTLKYGEIVQKVKEGSIKKCHLKNNSTDKPKNKFKIESMIITQFENENLQNRGNVKQEKTNKESKNETKKVSFENSFQNSFPGFPRCGGGHVIPTKSPFSCNGLFMVDRNNGQIFRSVMKINNISIDGDHYLRERIVSNGSVAPFVIRNGNITSRTFVITPVK